MPKIDYFCQNDTRAEAEIHKHKVIFTKDKHIKRDSR